MEKRIVIDGYEIKTKMVLESDIENGTFELSVLKPNKQIAWRGTVIKNGKMFKSILERKKDNAVICYSEYHTFYDSWNELVHNVKQEIKQFPLR